MGKGRRKRGKSNESDPCCGECNKSDISDDPKDDNSKIDWVVCGSCEKWCHLMCVAANEKAREVLKEEENVYVFCKNCQKSGASFLKGQSGKSDNDSMKDDRDLFLVSPKGTSKSSEQYAKEMKGIKHLVASLSNENAGLRSELTELKGIVLELGVTVKDLKRSNELGMHQILTNVNEMTKSVESSVESNQVQSNENINTVKSMSLEPPKSLDPLSYSEKLKMPKNSILVKPKDKQVNAVENAEKVAKSLVGVPIQRTKITKEGNIILQIESKKNTEAAIKKLNENGSKLGIESSLRNKIKPKIMITNVTNLESKEKVRENILKKEDWLAKLVDDGGEFALISGHKGRDENTHHCIFRCTPEIRKAIATRGDVLHTLYTKCKVYNHYYVYQCFNCQKFAHKAQACTEKTPICVKCSGPHKVSECNNNNRVKCANCKHTDADSNHWANSHECPRMKLERSKVADNTDHGL